MFEFTPERRERLAEFARRAGTVGLLQGPRSQVAAYRMPKYLEWAVESLARQMHRGKDAAFHCALEFGMSRLLSFRGISEILKIRSEAVQNGDPEAMNFFEHFGTVDVDTGGAGVRERAYKRHVQQELAERVGRIGSELGIAQGQFAVVALMAAFVDAPAFVRKRIYRNAMQVTLRRFSARLRSRATKAQDYAEIDPIERLENPEPPFDELFRDLSRPIDGSA